MKRLVFKITHNGREWVVRNESMTLSSPTLDELDIRMGELLRERGEIGQGERVRVIMEFDSSSIPQWIRQYTHHYFDRVVEIEG
jgi:hypothetical protein